MVKTKEKEKEFEINIEFKTFRIIKSDNMNFAIERKYLEGKRKGEWAENSRKFYPSFSLAVEGTLDKMEFNEKEGKKLKKAVEQMKLMKDELIQALKKVSI